MGSPAEFGHFGSINRDIDSWGAGPFVISDGKRKWRFEDSDRFGPALINRRGDPLTNPYPGSRSPFWRLHRIWKRQGRRLAEDGTCLWDEPKPMAIRHMGGRNYKVVEYGEEDGAIITLPRPATPAEGGDLG